VSVCARSDLERVAMRHICARASSNEDARWLRHTYAIVVNDWQDGQDRGTAADDLLAKEYRRIMGEDCTVFRAVFDSKGELCGMEDRCDPDFERIRC